MPEIIVPAATTASELAYERALLETRRRMALAALIAGAAALIFALAVLWLILSTPKATGFDADGVRCYRAANELSCIKTAEPPR
jgi:sugar phosphate permease